MDNQILLLLGTGILLITISLILIILRYVKGNYRISVGIMSLVVGGFIFIAAGMGLMTPNLKEKITSTESKNAERTLAEDSTSDGKVTNEVKIEEINESEPQKIARKLVKQEMAKQVGLKSWEITESEIYSDAKVNNVADYDKLVGEMRKVWITGNVLGTAEDDGSTGNVGYDLELYKMNGNNKWYIGKHSGVLANLEVTETPIVNEKYLSNSKEIQIPKESSQLKEDKSSNPKQLKFTENDLTGAWHWKDSEDFFMILRNNNTYSYIEKNAGFHSEGTYTVNQFNDHLEVVVQYTTGENDSAMSINLIGQNLIEVNEVGHKWKAEKVKLGEAESILNSLKGK